jgi:hypothetical protein
MTQPDLTKLGVVIKRLAFSPQKLIELSEKLTPKAQIEVPKLQTRILDIYDHVNLDVSMAISLEILP